MNTRILNENDQLFPVHNTDVSILTCESVSYHFDNLHDVELCASSLPLPV
jgi:hypothetical protein